jgi:4-hydroxybutyrate dehydrogenase
MRGDALFASTLAGISMTNSNCGPVHALAYPVGETYHMSHGEATISF